MWLSKKFISKQIYTLPHRCLSQITMSPESINLHKKRESTALFDPEMIPDDAIQGYTGFIDNPYAAFSSETKIDNKAVDEMIETNYSFKQEFSRKLLHPRNQTLEEKNYPHVGDNEIESEKFAELFRFPRTQPYKRISAGELYRVAHDEVHDEHILRSKSFLKDLFKPFELRDENLINVIKKLDDKTGERQEVIKELKALIPRINFDLLPNLCLHLSIVSKERDVVLWKTIEKAVMEQLSLFTFHQLCKIIYAQWELKPKVLGPDLDKALLEKIMADLDKASSYDLMYAMQCMRNKNNVAFFEKCKNLLIANKSKYLNEVDEKDDKERIHLVINLLYSYFSNFPRVQMTKSGDRTKNSEELMVHYEFEMLDKVQFCDKDHLTRLALSLYLMTSCSFPNIMRRVEYQSRDLKDKLDEYNLANIIKSLTRAKKMPYFGENKTFIELEPKIQEKINNFDIRNLSHIMYSYAVREQGNPEFHKKLLKRLNDEDKPYDYQTISNILYYLMINNNKDEKLWTRLISNTLENDGYIPVRQYTPYKLSKYYLQHHFPNMDIKDYTNKFFFPERYYNASLNQSKILSSQEKFSFSNFLYLHLHLVPVHYVTFHNLITLRHCFMQQKIAINFFVENEVLPCEGRVSGKDKLHSKIMSYEGWEILDITSKEHDSMDLEQKKNFYRSWILEAKNKQIEKGILPKVEPQYV